MRVWSEKNGRADVTVHGFTWIDNIVVIAGGFIVLVACIASLAVLS